MLPSRLSNELEASAVDLIRESAALGSTLTPRARVEVVELLRVINSYYSNLIEGHGTRPIDIERALRGDYSKEPAKRIRQLESRAHIEVQRKLEARLAADPELDLCAPALLCWLHEQFYEEMPEELRLVQHEGVEARVVPGQLRTSNVKVGRHLAPLHEHVGAFLSRFHDAYGARQMSPMKQIISVAASHHRLAWIHPFLDGNGRVTRLFTHAYLKRIRLDGHGLWAASRGLARKRDEYFRFLQAADEPRRGDLDGCGNLADAGLAEFCSFFMETCLDQIRYMRELLDLERLEERVLGYAELASARRELPKQAAYLLRDVLLRGEVPRGEAPRITGSAERSARAVVAALVDRGLLKSDSPKGPVRLGFPSHVVPYYFPRLYPASLEDEMRHER
ncbi:MAG: Fic family protein [Labilithrix sp.]|nr:Fic family protein [Labilithrix sp.]